jgi:CubicO group peptidase (beta-lactamase class C family)
MQCPPEFGVCLFKACGPTADQRWKDDHLKRLQSRRVRLAVPALIVAMTGTSAAADQLVRYDFSGVTAIANSMIAGQNVVTPVPGFDLLIMINGAEHYHQSFGNWSLDRTANADSATKTISGAVLASLMESSPQPFSLNTTLGQYITGLPAAKAGITIRQAFSHTSGIDADGIAPNIAQGNASITLQQAAAQLLQPNLEFTPGSTFFYGGSSMHVAGAVAELAGQASWNTLFQTRIADPMGFQVTRYALSGPSNPRVAAGCESNASEFSRFMEMLRRGGIYREPSGLERRILAADKAQMIFDRQSAPNAVLAYTPVPGVSDYGIGVWLDRRDAQGNLSGALAAGARGFSSWIDFDDNLVGTFATDTSNSGNILPALVQIRNAAEAAAQNPIICLSDFDASGDLSVQDIFDFLDAWFASNLSADINASGTLSTLDIFAFLNRWFAGC